MPDIHVSMLALQVPNLLPESDSVDRLLPAARASTSTRTPSGCAPPGRLIWSTLLFAIGIVHRVLAGRKKPKPRRARHLGPDNSRRDVRVGDDGPRLRHDPARVGRPSELVPQLQHGDLPHAEEQLHPLRHHPVGGRRHRGHRHLRHRAGAAGLAVRALAEAPRARRRAATAADRAASRNRGGPLSRLRRRREKRVSAYGRPVTTAGE